MREEQFILEMRREFQRLFPNGYMPPDKYILLLNSDGEMYISPLVHGTKNALMWSVPE